MESASALCQRGVFLQFLCWLPAVFVRENEFICETILACWSGAHSWHLEKISWTQCLTFVRGQHLAFLTSFENIFNVFSIIVFKLLHVFPVGGAEEYEEVWQIYPAQEGDRVPCCIVTEGAWTWFGCIVFTLALLGMEAAPYSYAELILLRWFTIVKLDTLVRNFFPCLKRLGTKKFAI